LRHALRRARHNAVHRFRGSQQCSVCGYYVDRFTPLTDLPEFKEVVQRFAYDPRELDKFNFETFNVHQYACPHCKASDRCRLYALHVREQLNETNSERQLKLLDIAPSKPLAAFVQRTGRFLYRSADAYPGRAQDQIDIQAMVGYRDGEFDCLLCSHVLEHVPDDAKAIAELYRVLKPGGWAIIMAPVSLAIEQTQEDANVTDPAERFRLYGSDEHLRLYAKGDFVRRLQQSGFRVTERGAKAFPDGWFSRHAITPCSVLYVASKPVV
jgi:hypothetical protein